MLYQLEAIGLSRDLPRAPPLTLSHHVDAAWVPTFPREQRVRSARFRLHEVGFQSNLLKPRVGPSSVSLAAPRQRSVARHVSRSVASPKLRVRHVARSAWQVLLLPAMAAREVTVVFGEERFEVQVEVDMGVEVLQIQVFSLTGVEPENQLLSLSSGPSLDLSSPHADLASLLPVNGTVLVLHDRGKPGAEGEMAEKEEATRAERETEATGEEGKEGGKGESSREDDEELARRLQEEEDAALAQQIQQSEAHAMQTMLQQQLRGQQHVRWHVVQQIQQSEAHAVQTMLQQMRGGQLRRQQPPQQQHGQAALEGRLLSLWSNVMQYEDPSRQTKARSLIPLQQLEEVAAVSLAKQGQYQPSEGEFRDAVLRQLLVWFKSWFRWLDSPPCPRCRTPTCAFHGSGTPSNEDLLWGGERVELHRCKQCGTVARFVRYNDPAKLLDTREGRCGEWANAFTLCCRALGYDARQVCVIG
ncbi:unnamed protein product [Closterium sp. Yama58-4]|nr:unnamed protein product [Closterium sp. Yama58-4]